MLYDRISSGDIPLAFDDGTTRTGTLFGDLTGAAVGFDVFFGGINRPGLALGAALQGQVGPSMRSGEVSAAGVTAGERFKADSFSVTLLGAAFDYYPVAWEGFHFGAALGLALAKGSAVTWQGGGSVVTEHSGTGWGGSLSAGYEWPISGSGSAGLHARLLYASASTDSDDFNGFGTWYDEFVAPTLGATVAFH